MSNTWRACTFALLLVAALAFAQEAPAAGANPPAPVAWSSLAPEQQKLLSQYGGQWNSLPPARQQALAHGSERWLGMSREQWHNASPSQRQQMIEHARERGEKGQTPRPAPQAPRPQHR